MDQLLALCSGRRLQRAQQLFSFQASRLDLFTGLRAALKRGGLRGHRLSQPPRFVPLRHRRLIPIENQRRRRYRDDGHCPAQ